MQQLSKPTTRKHEPPNQRIGAPQSHLMNRALINFSSSRVLHEDLHNSESRPPSSNPSLLAITIDKPRKESIKVKLGEPIDKGPQEEQ